MSIIPSAELKRAFSAWLLGRPHFWGDAPGCDENAPLALNTYLALAKPLRGFYLLHNQHQEQLSAADLRTFDDQGAALAQLGICFKQELFLFVKFQVQNVAQPQRIPPELTRIEGSLKRFF